MITAKENISGCFRTMEVSKGHATPCSAAIVSRKRNPSIPEVFSGTPESFIETFGFERADMPLRADLRQYRQNQAMI